MCKPGAKPIDANKLDTMLEDIQLEIGRQLAAGTHSGGASLAGFQASTDQAYLSPVTTRRNRCKVSRKCSYCNQILPAQKELIVHNVIA